MGRELLSCIIEDNHDNKIFLSTSHLESQQIGKVNRQKQNKISFENLQVQTESNNCSFGIFGGDLNARDNEVKIALKDKKKIHDAWEFSGNNQNKFTWDLLLNDNVTIPGAKFKPRCRFDRLYFVENSAKVDVKRFDLVGTERLDHGRFPSDHFGIFLELNF